LGISFFILLSTNFVDVPGNLRYTSSISETMHMDFSLTELGFSANADTVYYALLTSGRVTVTKLQEATGLHPQIIYNAIDELQREGLASFVYERGRRIFQAASPEVLADIQRTRLSKIENILPALLEKHEKHKQQSVFIYSGNADFQKARERIIRSIPKGGCYYVINNGGKRFKQAMEGTYSEQERLRVKRGIHKKILDFSDSFKEIGQPTGEAEKFSEYRYLADSEGGPTSTLFGGEYLRINVWSDPVLTILIQNKELVESYQRYFEILWERAQSPV
jgi:sugar-specific transcriptional regulator TrmB